MSITHIVADGATTLFAYPFAIHSETEIEVQLDGIVVTTGFSIVGEGSVDGGHIHFTTPPAAGTTVTLRRQGKVEVSDQDLPGFLEDKLVAGDYLNITKQNVAEGEILVISGDFNGEDYLRKDQNLADLPDAGTARGNLGLGTAATRNVGTGPGEVVELDAQSRLPAVDGSQLTNIPFGRVKVNETDSIADFLDVKLVAGDNVTISTTTGASGQALEIAATTAPEVEARFTAHEQRINTLIHNQGILALRSQIASGWSTLNMIDGWADEFEDEAGVANVTNGNYDAAAHCYDNTGSGTVALIPTMTDADSPEGLATATNIFGGTSNGFHLFDGSGQQVEAIAYPASVEYAFANNEAVAVTGYEIMSGPESDAGGTVNYRTPYKWQLRYWDGNQWQVADDRSSAQSIFSDYETRSYTLPSVIAASQWQLLILEAHPSAYSGYAQFGEMQLLSPSPATDMTLVSGTVLPAQSAPDEARLLLLHEAVDPATLNTDLIAEISRDDGTTWSAVQLAEEGPFDATTDILVGTADLTGQPTGTAMRWRIRTLNNKHQRLHGVWMQWQ